MGRRLGDRDERIRDGGSYSRLLEVLERLDDTDDEDRISPAGSIRDEDERAETERQSRSDSTEREQPMTMGHIEGSPDRSIRGNTGWIVQLDLGKYTLTAAVCIGIVFLGVGVVVGVDIAERAAQERQTAIQHDQQIALEQQHQRELLKREEATHDAYIAADRDSRLVEYYIHEIDGKMIAAGLLKPSQRFDEFKKRYQKEHQQ